MRGGVCDKALFDELLATLNKKLDVYDEILGKQKYLAGDVSILLELITFTYEPSASLGNYSRRPLPPSLRVIASVCWHRYYGEETKCRALV